MATQYLHWIPAVFMVILNIVLLFTVTVLSGLMNKRIKLLKLYTTQMQQTGYYKVCTRFSDTVISNITEFTINYTREKVMMLYVLSL